MKRFSLSGPGFWFSNRLGLVLFTQNLIQQQYELFSYIALFL